MHFRFESFFQFMANPYRELQFNELVRYNYYDFVVSREGIGLPNLSFKSRRLNYKDSNYYEFSDPPFAPLLVQKANVKVFANGHGPHIIPQAGGKRRKICQRFSCRRGRRKMTRRRSYRRRT